MIFVQDFELVHLKTRRRKKLVKMKFLTLDLLVLNSTFLTVDLFSNHKSFCL